ncbi:MAG: hypothetical protein ACO2ZP_13485 [Bacteriovoracaceae bacterium]
MASGPSLTEEVIEIIRPYKDRFIIFGCNDVYKVVDYLDVHYACDTAWWNTWGEHFKATRPNLESWTQCGPSAEKYNVNYIAGKNNKGLSLNPELIHYGSNSGYQQLNLAFLTGCAQFILVGYNMKKSAGKSHFFGDHPANLKKNSPYSRFVDAFNEIQPEIKNLIINCTPNSALKVFQENSLEKVLEL